MSKKSSPSTAGSSTATSVITLIALTDQINQFVQKGTLDSRCAAKLAKRLKKEAESVLENSGKGTKSAPKDLQTAFATLETSLRDYDAKLLVAANAALRQTD